MFGKFALRDQVITWVDRAIDVQDGTLRSYLSQASERETTAGGDQGDRAAAALESQYLATVSGAGAAVGGAASIPGIGTGLAVGLSVAETVAFLDATALFALAAAETKRCRVRDLSRRRALLLLVLLGDDAVKLVPRPVDGGMDGWGRRLVELDDDSVTEINRTTEKWLLTRFGPRQGMFIVGRLIPFGVGAAVGAAGNALTAKGVIARVRSAFAGSLPAPQDPAPVAEAATPTSVVMPLAGEAALAPETASPASTIEPPSGKYAGLYTYLQSVADDEIVLLIAELDALVTGGLPAAARKNPSWWGNDATARAPQTRAWLAAGLRVSEVELADEKVRLRRGRVPAEGSATASA
jgi:hypothetical protein